MNREGQNLIGYEMVISQITNPADLEIELLYAQRCNHPELIPTILRRMKAIGVDE